jgi:HAD superfamily 5'-nucleotidase-like hydrolase
MQKVFINRTLNLKRIKYLGFDMDHTLIRYNSVKFEELSFEAIKHKLLKRGYPSEIQNLKFEFDLAIRGLAIDRHRGNILKLNRHCAIRQAYHGTKPIDYRDQAKIYPSTYIDLADPDYFAIDTAFSISFASMYMQLVDLKEAHPAKLPSYLAIANDVLQTLDEAHRDGSVKNEVKTRLHEFVLPEPELISHLERYKKHGKNLFIVTNSEFSYTKALLDHAVNPYLKEHSSWMKLFEFVIVSAQKPRFFYEDQSFLQIDPQTGNLRNLEGTLVPGVYQGGSAKSFSRDLSLLGDEILYIGDHIYGDIIRLKKDCRWRTALVVEELDREIEINKKTKPLSDQIDRGMKSKEPLEDELTRLLTEKTDDGHPNPARDQRIDELQKEIAQWDQQISQLIIKHYQEYNKKWGPCMRTGNEESFFAYQVDRYACVYMSKLADLLAESPRSYFRAPRRPLAHEVSSAQAN